MICPLTRVPCLKPVTCEVATTCFDRFVEAIERKNAEIAAWTAEEDEDLESP